MADGSPPTLKSVRDVELFSVCDLVSRVADLTERKGRHSVRDRAFIQLVDVSVAADG